MNKSPTEHQLDVIMLGFFIPPHFDDFREKNNYFRVMRVIFLEIDLLIL